MIGKSLNARHGVRPLLPPAEAVATLAEHLDAQARYIVEVRAADPNMIACLVAVADEAAVRMCRSLGFDMKAGGSGVFGLLGPDAARAFPELPALHRGWLTTPCAPRETKVLLIARGIGLLSLETRDARVHVTAFAPQAPPPV